MVNAIANVVLEVVPISRSIEVSNKQNVSSPLTLQNSVLPLTPKVYVGYCHMTVPISPGPV